MDLQLVLVALGCLAGGVLLGVLALWCRAGRSRAARFWVRQEAIDRPGPFPYAEGAVLVVLPLLAQLLIVIGLLVGVTSVDVLADAGLGGIYAAAVIAELILWALVLLPSVYRTVLPLWLYPSWLREQRARDRQWLRSRR
ncbi:hypothetical protein [Brachybacterium sp. YJGR34]|uniref:hypothetical protein n=1 Tax=Brachybacterium sp. YJGR34 TaxID=2059911 RepID=UPI000E0C0A59|nr:hypothetical protein [Brachybacterium sp. YJGR34]